MPSVVIDASAGAEIVTDTRRGQALSRLLPPDTEGWVPEHFYAEVLGLIRRRTVVKRDLSETEGAEAVRRLGAWRLHRVSIRPMLVEAWSYRHNMTAADAFYVVLCEQLRADFLTDDHNLVDGSSEPLSG